MNTPSKAEALVEAGARALLERRGFGFYLDPTEGGQDAYDITLEALEDARAVLATLPPQHSSGDARAALAEVARQAQESSRDRIVLSMEQGRALAALGSQGRPAPDALALVDGFIAEIPADLTSGTQRDQRWAKAFNEGMRIAASAIRGRILQTFANPSPSAGYVEAFYDLAKLMGIGARANSPKEVWESEMRPRLVAALASRPAPDGWVLPAELLELNEKATAGQWETYRRLPVSGLDVPAYFIHAGRDDRDDTGFNVVLRVYTTHGYDGTAERDANAAFVPALVNWFRSLASSPSALPICPECDPPGSGEECRGGPCSKCAGTGRRPSALPGEGVE